MEAYELCGHDLINLFIGENFFVDELSIICYSGLAKKEGFFFYA